MKLNKLFLFISLLLISPIIVNANCTKEELLKFKEIENKTNIEYEYNEDTKKYNITFTLPKNDLILYSITNLDIEKIEDCTTVNDETLFCKNVSLNKNKVEIEYKCKSTEEIIKTITKKILKTNEYYQTEYCDGIEEFYLCQETIDEDIDYDTFISRINSYKKSKKSKKSKKETNNQEAQEENKIIEYISKNLVTVIVVSLFIILLIITFILTLKGYRKSRRLE